MPTLTVYIASGGATVNQEPNTGLPGTSQFGHMWYSVSPDGTVGNASSFGFAPDPAHNGSPFAPGQVYTNDTFNYVANPAKNGTVTSYSVNVSSDQYNTLLAFGQAGVLANGSATSFNFGGASFNNHYNGLNNSCVDFTWTALSTIGMGMPSHIPGTMLLPTWNANEISQSIQKFTSSGPQEKPVQNQYDGQGNLILEINRDINGNVISKTSFVPGASGESAVTTNASGSVVGTQTGTMDAGTGAFSIDSKGVNLSGAVVNDQNISTTASNVTNVAVSGAGAVVEVTGANIAFNGSGANDWVIGNNNNIVMNGWTGVHLTDGTTNTISGTGGGAIYAAYGTINLAPGQTGVQVLGNNESVTGGAGNYVVMQGQNITYTGSGGEVGLNYGSSVTVIGSDRVDLNSNVVLNASNCTLNIGSSNVIGDIINGSYDNFVNDVGGFQATIGGTYDTGLTGPDTLTWEGSTTGDSTDGGTDVANPDLAPPPSPPPSIPDPVCEDDPIILALNGGKVQTQNLSTSTAYFDMQNNGVKDHTGWGTVGEGYLMYDPANKNTVSNEQSLLPSFAALKKLDTNGDNVINSLDTTWNSLKVWVDNNANGTFTAGSIKTLGQLGIVSINLNSTHVNTNQNNNTILDDSTFTWASGATGDIAGVNLNFHASTVTNIVRTGGGGGGACVHVASMLPDGTQAGDVKVGEAMLLADEKTLAPGAGVVSYSARKTAEGYRIKTKSGASLVCSDTAPIPTPEGLILAPNLAGKRVAVRKDEAGSSLVMWDDVTSVEHVGVIDIQHITVGNKCFWAGEKKDAFILHHNLKMIP